MTGTKVYNASLWLLFVSMVPLANWLISNVGTTCVPQGPCLIPVGFGFMAPSGVLLIGFALVLRDLVQDRLGYMWSLVAIGVGCMLSLLTAPPLLAVASAAAFTVAELADFAVYSKLRDKGKDVAVFFSGIVGAFADSALFVYLAFGNLDFSLGNTLGKLYATLAVALYFYSRRKVKM